MTQITCRSKNSYVKQLNNVCLSNFIRHCACFFAKIFLKVLTVLI